jgi:hypothetical protein
MTDPGYCHISIIADRSASMAGSADSPYELARRAGEPTKADLTTSGIHQLVREQREQPGRLTVSLMHFDTSHETVENFGDGTLTLAWRCQPRGGTALLDAVGRTIDKTGEQLDAMPEDQRPGKVIVIIGTDGYENSSHEYDLAQVKAMIERQRNEFGWEFVFQGAGIDAFHEADAMGIAAASTLSTSDQNSGVAYASTSSAITRTRTTGESFSYSTGERAAAGSE